MEDRTVFEGAAAIGAQAAPHGFTLYVLERLAVESGRLTARVVARDARPPVSREDAEEAVYYAHLDALAGMPGAQRAWLVAGRGLDGEELAEALAADDLAAHGGDALAALADMEGCAPFTEGGVRLGGARLADASELARMDTVFSPAAADAVALAAAGGTVGQALAAACGIAQAPSPEAAAAACYAAGRARFTGR